MEKISLTQINRNTTDRILLDRNLTDLLKFLSCIMIALHHYSQLRVVAGTNNPIYQLFSTQGGWLGVAVFFFLSGYGLMKSDLNNHLTLFPFLKKRLLKTYLPAVLVTLIWVIYLVVNQIITFDFNILYIIFWDFHDVLWFVRAIIFLYVIFFIYRSIQIYLRKHLKYFSLDFFILAICAFSATFLLSKSPFVGFVHGSSVLLFFVGMCVAQYDSVLLKFIRKVYPVIIFFCLIIFWAIINRHDAEWIHLFIDYFFIFFSLLILSIYDVRINILPTWLGSVSYDVYLVHNKILMILKIIFPIIPFWLYLLFTSIIVPFFYNLRKMFKL